MLPSLRPQTMPRKLMAIKGRMNGLRSLHDSCFLPVGSAPFSGLKKLVVSVTPW